MNHQRLLVLWVLFLLHALFPVVAQDVRVQAILPEVEAGGVARFRLFVTNTLPDPGVFKLAALPSGAAPFSKHVQRIHITPNQLKIAVNRTGYADVEITLTDAVVPGKDYTSAFKVTSLLNPELSAIVSITTRVIALHELVQIAVAMPSVIVPGEDVQFTVAVKSQLDVELTGYTLSFVGELAGFTAEEIITLRPREEITKIVVIPLDVQTMPGTYTLEVRLSKNGATKKSVSKTFVVAEKPLVEETKQELRGFLQRTLKVTKRNRGNVASHQKIELATSFFKSLFTRSSAPSMMDNGKLSWEFSLQPGEDVTLEIVTSYRSLFYGLLFILVATFFLVVYVERSVTLKKRLLHLKEHERGVSEFRFFLYVKNGTRRMLTHARLIDVVPHTLELTKDFGTLRPTKILQGQHALRLLWDIPEIAPQEERVITYTITTKFRGSLTLPPASLHYMRGNTLVSVRSLPMAYQR